MGMKETLLSILNNISLLEELEEKEETELVEVEVGLLSECLFLKLLMDINSNKEELNSFFNFLEDKALEEPNPYELTNLNQMLELKPIVNSLEFETIVEDLAERS